MRSAVRARSVTRGLASLLLLIVLADGRHDGRAHLADEGGTVLGRPVTRARGGHGRALKVREDVAGEELVAPTGLRRVSPFVGHVEVGAEAAVRLLDEALDLGDGIVGR